MTARPVLLTTPRLRGGEGTGPPGSEMLWSRAGGLQELSPPYFSGFSKTAKIYIFFSPNPSCFIYVVSLSLSLSLFLFFMTGSLLSFKSMCVCVLVAQSWPTLCDSMDCRPPGFSVHEIFQTRILEWVAMSFSSESSRPRDRTQVSCIAGRFFNN